MCIASNARLKNILKCNRKRNNRRKLVKSVYFEIDHTNNIDINDPAINETSFDLDHAYYIGVNDKKAGGGAKIDAIECLDVDSDESNDTPDVLDDLQEKDDYHKNDKLLCSTCGTWQSQSNLKRHMQTHLGVARRAPYKCPHCGNTFINRPSFIAHTNRHEGIKPFECKICQKSFHGSNLLRTHMFSHSKTNQFACTECDKVFRFPHYLSQHRRTHNPPTIYKCEECDYSNVFLHNFKNHQRKHTGVFRYTCECGKGFNRRSLFSLHQERNHKENN